MTYSTKQGKGGDKEGERVDGTDGDVLLQFIVPHTIGGPRLYNVPILWSFHALTNLIWDFVFITAKKGADPIRSYYITVHLPCLRPSYRIEISSASKALQHHLILVDEVDDLVQVKAPTSRADPEIRTTCRKTRTGAGTQDTTGSELDRSRSLLGLVGMHKIPPAPPLVWKTYCKVLARPRICPHGIL